MRPVEYMIGTVSMGGLWISKQESYFFLLSFSDFGWCCLWMKKKEDYDEVRSVFQENQ